MGFDVWGRAAIAVALVVVACACEGASGADAGPPLGDAGGGADGGAPVDPLGASFSPIAAEGEGPWGLWGYFVARIDDTEAIVLGGTDAGTASNLVYDTAWRVRIGPEGLRATRLSTTGPPPRYCGCATYDAARERVIVYGGRDLSAPAGPPGTWELDPSTEIWTEVAGADQNPSTLGCAMAYLPSAGATYMFGGASTAGPSALTYRYDPDGGGWIELDASGPLARYDGGLFVAPDGEALLLFAGSYAARGAGFYADLWRFDATEETWTEIAMPEGPPGRRTPWVVPDPARNGLYVGFGYDPDMRPMVDLWYADLDASSWTAIEVPFEGPLPRGFARALPGGEGALGTVMGGYGAMRPVEESWRLVR